MLAARLQADGAQVVAYDPVAEEQARKLDAAGSSSPPRRSRPPRGADAAVLVTEWPAVPGARLGRGRAGDARQRWSIDGRNALDPAAVRAAGLLYEGIGRR